jgi:peptidoglycan/LPS O-acetylase OafA/YrhL
VASRPMAVVRHTIPSLDGMRAISIAIVVLSHSKALLPSAIADSGLFRYIVGGGLHGVQVFFVISGYLITMLLVREFEATGDISLRRFYSRRTVRIFPVFYAYLAVVAVLWAAGFERQDASTFLSAATYTIIYHPHPRGWLVQHAWSLSIEEQFYLLWPAVLLMARRQRIASPIAISVLAVMPIVRILILTFSARGVAEHGQLIVLSSAIDTLMMGCLLALLSSNLRWRRWCERWIRSWSVAGLVAVGFVLVPYASAKLTHGVPAAVCVAFGASATAISIGAALDWLVRIPNSAAGQVLNAGPVRYVGLISYSIYVWQQLFTGPATRLGLVTYPLLLIAAELSFRLIERPMMRVRARLV